MKSIAMLSCLLLSSLMLNCNRDNNPQTIMMKKSPEVLAKQVQITSCTPDKDQVQVHDNDPFTWYVAAPDTNSYDVVFLYGRTPIGTASVTVTPAQPAKVQIQKDEDCKKNEKNCYYSYMLLQRQSGQVPTTFCHDPGMHIIP